MAEEDAPFYTFPLSTSAALPLVRSSSSSSSDQNPPASSAAQMRRLLISCAELLSQSNIMAAHSLVSFLYSTSKPEGDSTERLVHQFARALSARLNRVASVPMAPSLSSINPLPHPHFLLPPPPPPPPLHFHPNRSRFQEEEETALLDQQIQSSYICLNQVTPFIRFCHLTANQAILEVIEGQHSVHILDFDIVMQGVQWPPLMQAIAGMSNPPNMIRITGTGYHIESLRRTGQRLENFAESLGLRFQFHPLVLVETSSVALQLSSSVALLHEETLVVNCVLYLHRLLNTSDDEVRLFLRTVKAMNPKVFTLAEREANLNHPIFSNRFLETLDHYTALFDSMEATLHPKNRERIAVEQVWLGREIVNVVSAEGEERRERYERFQKWAEKMRRSGFENIQLSPFAVSQAKLLLRLHYPSEGYQLQILNDSLFLGWQNHALFSVSSWH